jgi:hypothetical protein
MKHRAPTPAARARRTALWTGAGIAFGAAALAWWAHTRATTAAQARAREERALATVVAQATRLEAEFAAGPEASRAAPSRASAEVTAPAAAAAIDPGAPPAALFAQHPEWRPLFEASEKASLLQLHAAFVAQRGLSPAAADGFAAELLRHGLAAAELRRLAPERSGPATEPAFQQMLQTEESRHARELATILGADGVGAFAAYERTASLRPLVEELAQRLYFTPQPVTPALAEQIVDVLARHRAAPDGKIPPESIDWPAALGELRPVLPALALRELERVRETAELQRQMNQIVRRATRR